MPPFTLFPKSTALVLIDLQKGIIGLPLEPRSGRDVVASAGALASQFRALGAPVFLARVAFPVGPAALRLTTDASPPLPAVEPPDWYDLALEPQPSDVFIHKRHWGAFYGTDLDLQLRRRRIETIVLGGIATNFGVESTARFAHELGYEQIFAEDAMASFTKANHDFAIQNILPRLGRVRVVGEILPALREGK